MAKNKDDPAGTPANLRESDLQKIKELIEIMKENGLVEVEITTGGDTIFLKRGQAEPAVGGTVTTGPKTGAVPVGPNATEAPTTPSQAVPQPAPVEEELIEIKSPLVGTFYATPSPDSPPYVEIGSEVGPQTIVCIIEAMKVMNEIKAETSGTIAEIAVTNGQAVEYGQVLFKVKPD